VTPRAAELVRLLGLSTHPEGGAYRETWRSPSPPSVRAAATTIYFLLDRGERSRWHRADADEIWTHLEGGPLELQTWVEGQAVERCVLGPVDAAGARPVAVVPAGVWQAARPLDGYVLSGCTVAPGFEFKGFTLLGDDAALAARFRKAQPGFTDLV
jgi:predicted cupin superfamily sugar epimerase